MEIGHAALLRLTRRARRPAYQRTDQASLARVAPAADFAPTATAGGTSF